MPFLPEFDGQPYDASYGLLAKALHTALDSLVEKVIIRHVCLRRQVSRPDDSFQCVTIFFANPGQRENELADNKPYCRFFISFDGTIEIISRHHWTTPKGYVRLPKFRKQGAKSVAVICEKLVKYANETKAASPFN